VSLHIASIGGDGIGPEVTREAERLLTHLCAREDIPLTLTPVERSADRYLATGETLPDDVFTFLPAEAARAGVPVSVEIELDDHGGAERIFVLVGETPLDEEEVREVLFRHHRTPLAELDRLPELPHAQRSLWLVKEAP